MASYWQKMIFIALILAIAIPISTGRHHRRRPRKSHHLDSHDSGRYMRDLCYEADRPDVCRNILKEELHRFHGSDDRDIAKRVIDLAKAKSKEIWERLSHYHRDSNDDGLKKKYYLCSENYNDVNRGLEESLRNLESNNYKSLLDQIDDAEDELDECMREFESGSFDPGHVEDRNNEFEVYLDIVRAATDRLQN